MSVCPHVRNIRFQKILLLTLEHLSLCKEKEKMPAFLINITLHGAWNMMNKKWLFKQVKYPLSMDSHESSVSSALNIII